MSFRVEEKIALTPSDMMAMRAELDAQGLAPLHPARRIRSVYFDTEDFAMFHASEEGVLPRWKLRLRTYPDAAEAGWTLERKTSSTEGRYKTSESVGPARAARLVRRGMTDPEIGFVRAVAEVDYSREYRALDGRRVTFDRDIRYRAPGGGRWITEAWNVVEIKVAAGTSPDALAGLIATPRRRFSKYCNAIRALGLA